jgi:hypothetical protein
MQYFLSCSAEIVLNDLPRRVSNQLHSMCSKANQLQKKALITGKRQSPPDGESQEFFCWLLVVFQLPTGARGATPNQIHLSNMANFESMPAFAHLFAPGGGGANANAPDASAFNPAASSLGFPMMPLGGYSGFQFPMATPMPCAE